MDENRSFPLYNKTINHVGWIQSGHVDETEPIQSKHLLYWKNPTSNGWLKRSGSYIYWMSIDKQPTDG